MAAIDGITKSGSGPGQAGGKSGASPVTGFDVLFAVSTEGAASAEAPAQGLGALIAGIAVPPVETGGEVAGDLELFLGLQPKAETLPDGSAAKGDVLPDGLDAMADPLEPALSAAAAMGLPRPDPSADLVKNIAVAAPPVTQMIAQSETAQMSQGQALDLGDGSTDDDDRLQDLRPEDVDDPDATQAAAAPSALLILEPAKPNGETDPSLGAGQKAAPPPPQRAVQMEPPLADPAVAELPEEGQDGDDAAPATPVDPAPLAAAMKSRQGPSPAMPVDPASVAAGLDIIEEADPANPASPVARMKIRLNSANAPVATMPEQGGAVTAGQAKDLAALDQTSLVARERADPAPLAPRDFDTDQRQTSGPKTPQGTPAAAASFDPVQASSAKAPAAAVSTAPMMAQLRQTLDTRDAAWRERLVDQALGTSKDKVQSITIALRPKSLGDMQLRVEITQSETTVRIVTETASAARLMMANEDLLSRLMEQSGARLASLSAQAVGQNGFGGQSFGQSMAQNSGGQGGRESAALRKERVRGADAARAEPGPAVKLGGTAQSSINLMA